VVSAFSENGSKSEEISDLNLLKAKSVFVGNLEKKKTEPKNAFYFMVLPLTKNQRSFPVHTMPGPSENAAKKGTSRLMEVIAKASEQSNVIYVAPDGDGGWNGSQSTEFQNALNVEESKNMSFPLLISDFLPLAKTMRYKIVK
jgi:hypothetical protein